MAELLRLKVVLKCSNQRLGSKKHATVKTWSMLHDFPHVRTVLRTLWLG